MSRRHDLAHAADRRLKKPLFVGRLVVERGVATCLLSDREVKIDAPGKLVTALARSCDGIASLDQILSVLGENWDRSDLSRLIDALLQQGVLCEARDLALAWWPYVRNPRLTDARADTDIVAALPLDAVRKTEEAIPSAVYRNVVPGEFASLLKRRSSKRTFSEKPVALETVLQLLWTAYGAASHRTVPSAGGIYPLQVHLINFRLAGDLVPGIHRVSYLADGRIGTELVHEATGAVCRAFLQPDELSFAQGVIVISGELGRTALKYEARAALYVPLEAGHAAQNVLLAAAEAELAAVEVGGFLDERLAELLKLSPGLVPLTTVLFGTAPSADQEVRAASAPAIEFSWIEAESAAYAPPFFSAAARITGTEGEWSYGRSTDPALAHVKANAEAQERWACGMPTGLQEARLADLANAISPEKVVAYSAAQYARPDFPYLPFNAEGSYLWKEGQKVLSGNNAFVLADLVYFGDALDRRLPYSSVSSSGAAAYTSEQGALERSVLELIERDAFMRAWLGRARRPTIDPVTLPPAVAARRRALGAAGVDVMFKDYSLGLAPVVFAFAQSIAHGFTLTTAGVAFETEEALDNALTELELGISIRLSMAKPRVVEPSDVRTPVDHMDLYAQRRYFRKADFLAFGGPTIDLLEAGSSCPKSWDELVALLMRQGREILWFDLTPTGASLRQGRVPLHIGRAIIPGMIPISFGRGQEPLASFDTQSSAGLRRQRHGQIKPAPYVFPHPFG